jgi:hypothetical protein
MSCWAGSRICYSMLCDNRCFNESDLHRPGFMNRAKPKLSSILYLIEPVRVISLAYESIIIKLSLCDHEHVRHDGGYETDFPLFLVPGAEIL